MLGTVWAIATVVKCQNKDSWEGEAPAEPVLSGGLAQLLN